MLCAGFRGFSLQAISAIPTLHTVVLSPQAPTHPLLAKKRITPELEFRVVIHSLMWLRGTKLGSSAGIASALTC